MLQQVSSYWNSFVLVSHCLLNWFVREYFITKLHHETDAKNLPSMHYHNVANDSDNNHCATGMSFLLTKDTFLYKNSILIYELLFLPITRCLLLTWYFGLSSLRLQVYVLIISSRWNRQKKDGKLKQLFHDQNDDIDFTDGENNDKQHQEELLAIAEKLSGDWQVDTWVIIVQYDEQWYPEIVQKVRLQNAHSQSTKLLMCKQETVFVPVVYQNNSYYLLFFLLD